MLKLLAGLVVTLTPIGYFAVRGFDWLIEHDYSVVDLDFLDEE